MPSWVVPFNNPEQLLITLKQNVLWLEQLNPTNQHLKSLKDVISELEESFIFLNDPFHLDAYNQDIQRNLNKIRNKNF